MQESELYTLPPASFLKRLLAGLYDWLLVIAILMLLSVPFVAASGAPIAAGNSLYQAFLVLVIAGFFCGFWYFGGQTVGMRAWRLRLVGEQRTRVAWRATLLRFVWAVAGALPVGAGYWCMLFDPAARSWHDRRSGTRIVQLPKPTPRQKPTL